MRQLIWRESALDDLDRIVTYIAQFDYAAATKLHALFERYSERLIDHPYRCRPGRAPQTREAVVHPNYVLIYRVGVDRVEILNIVHSRRLYPPGAER